MNANNPLINGVVDMVILHFLKQKDCYGYEITKAFTEYSEKRLPIPMNTVYTAIYKLEKDGMISEYSKLVGKRRTRIYYRLEKKGAEHLDKLFSDYRSTLIGVDMLMNKNITEEVSK